MLTFNFQHDCDHPNQVMQHAVDRIVAAYPDCVQNELQQRRRVAIKLRPLPDMTEDVDIVMSYTLDDVDARRSFSYSAYCEPIGHDPDAQARLYGVLSGINNIARDYHKRYEIPLVYIAGKVIELANKFPAFIYYHVSDVCKYNDGGDNKHYPGLNLCGCIVGQAIRQSAHASYQTDVDMLLSLLDVTHNNSSLDALNIEKNNPWSNLRITAGDEYIKNALMVAIREVQIGQDKGLSWQHAIKPLLNL